MRGAEQWGHWIGWGLAVLLAGMLIFVLWRNYRETLRQDQERARNEKRSRSEAASIRKQAEESAEQLRQDAERALQQAQQRATETKADLERRRTELEASLQAQRQELREQRSAQERSEARLHEREDRIVADAAGIQARTERLEQQRAELRKSREELRKREEQATLELERLAGISAAEARQEVVAEAERSARLEANALARDIESEARRNAERIARSVIVDAIQRCAAEQTSESVVSSIDLPSDDMKGRIIGREGRNIRAFEQITGVNVLIDDTPETVLLSSFDPVRREVARLTLLDLVADGRIHPARIEEVHERSERNITEQIRRNAEEALAEVGIVEIHPELLPTIGALAFRTSYGQNVLRHLVESAHLAGMMAAEIGIDVATCKRAAFLHDIGKALTHEHEGPHAIVGADLLRRHGEHQDVVHAVEAHHNEVEPQTVEAILVQAADAISGSRPGARRESIEAYVERMQHLESIATKHQGVERAYAMQAGRELRVMVTPEDVDDAGSSVLARELAKEIQANLTYPGQIKVTVVRESRATATAH